MDRGTYSQVMVPFTWVAGKKTSIMVRALSRMQMEPGIKEVGSMEKNKALVYSPGKTGLHKWANSRMTV